MSEVKRTLVKSVRLENYFRAYKGSQNNKPEVVAKFQDVWGISMASHFLSKYDNAESLIWALDGDNLDKFISKF